MTTVGTPPLTANDVGYFPSRCRDRSPWSGDEAGVVVATAFASPSVGCCIGPSPSAEQLPLQSVSWRDLQAQPTQSVRPLIC